MLICFGPLKLYYGSKPRHLPTIISYYSFITLVEIAKTNI